MTRVVIKYMQRVIPLTVIAACMLSVVSPVLASAMPQRLTNRDRSVTNAEVGQALRNTPGVLDTSAQVKTSSDADSAIVAATAGATVDIPKDAEAGVVLGSTKGGPNLKVSLPNAASAGDAQKVTNGVVSYPSNSGAANAVQTNADGSVRMLTVIDNPSAPTRYDYKITVPAGGRIVLASSNNGALIVDGSDKPIASVAAPWAKDATGMPIKTWFATNGQTLTQYVRHRVAGVTYPVTADPRVHHTWYGTYYYFNRDETNYVSLGMSSWLGSRVGGAVAAAIFTVGGQWAADQAKKRRQCVAAFMPRGYIYIQVYLTKC